MDENRAIIGIALLLSVSILVRIAPAFISFRFSEQTKQRIETNLPIAVFVNLIIYCIYQEATAALYPAIISVAIAFMLFKRLGLLASVIVASVVFVVSGQY